MSEVTRILSAIEAGDPAAAEQLLPLVYDELRKLAATKLSQEMPGQTLQPTALVHEAYLRLVGSGKEDKETGRPEDNAQENAGVPVVGSPGLPVSPSPVFANRGHFFVAAAECMRRILVDAARRKRRPKHGGQRQRVDLEDAVCLADDRAGELVALHEALEKLEAESQDKARLVKLRYFAGLSHQEAAEALGISRATADRYWAYAKAFLRCELDDARSP